MGDAEDLKSSAREGVRVRSPAPASDLAKERFSTKRAFSVHGVLGAWLGLLVSFVAATGTLAVFGPELDWLLVPPARSDGAVEGRIDVPWSALERAAHEAMPGARVHALAAPRADGFSAFALVEEPERTFHHVYLDPHDGHLLGTSGFRTPQRFLRDLHRSLLLGENVGLAVVGSLSIVLLVQLVTGLRTIRVRRAIATLPRDAKSFHRASAAWLLPFFALLVVTTVWYLGEHLFGLAEIRPSPIPTRRDPAAAARLRAGEPTLGVDELVDRCEAAYPELEVHFVALAVPRRPHASVTGPAGVPYVRDLASQVFVDPFDGHVLAIVRADELTWLQRWEHGVDFLHFGTWGGLPSRALYVALGAIVSAIAATGWVIRRRRLRPKPRPGAAAGQAPDRP